MKLGPPETKPGPPRIRVVAVEATGRRIKPRRASLHAIVSAMRPQEETADQEARRLVHLLADLVRISGRSLRSLEEELGMGSSVMSKILNGVIRPQLSYVLLIAPAIGISPAEFFQLAYTKKMPLHP